MTKHLNIHCVLKVLNGTENVPPMRILAAALTAIVASATLSARAAEGWIYISTARSCKIYVYKHDFSGRFRNFLDKLEQSDSGKCPLFVTGRATLNMADCERFRMRSYWKSEIKRENKWGEWTTPDPGTYGEAIIKEICI